MENNNTQANPVKVLQIGMTKNIGGLETYLMQQFDHMDHAKVMYDFVNITAEDDIVFHDKIEKAGGKVFGVMSRHSGPIRHYWQWYKLLKKVAKDYKAIVLNSNGLSYVYPLFLAKFFGIPHRIIHSHNSNFEYKVGWKKKLLIGFNKVLLNWSATDYFACSEKAGNWMFGNDHPFTVIHNAIDTTPFLYNEEIRKKKRKELGIADEFVIGHVGRFSYQKNHSYLIDIFHAFHEKHPHSLLLLIGGSVEDGSYLENTKEKVRRLGLETSVKFLGMRNDVPELMQTMDCFLFPSLFEGLCFVGIEAQASGLPCFFSDTITCELGITNLAHFISLKESPVHWADCIEQYSHISRRNMQVEIAEAGYDIDNEVQKVQAFYSR